MHGHPQGSGPHLVHDDPDLPTGQYDVDDVGDSVFLPRRGQTGLVIFAAALVSAGTVLGLQVSSARWGKSVVPVPVLVGLSELEARGAVESLGLVFVVSGTTPDPVVAKGGVAEQAPLAGTPVAPGRVVRVKVSSGLPGAATTGLPQAQPLEAALAVPAPPPPPPPPRPPPSSLSPPAPPPRASPSPRARPAVPALAPSPAARPVAPSVRPPLPAGSIVTVPKVVGVRLQLATARLQAAGLSVGRLSYATDEDHIESFVLRQTPTAGSSAPRGSAVDLVVNQLE